ncbi:hypothetical protein QYE76_047825 [Lolium multiflorum]|uniref:Reverse transcriptase zinc-binding domain-containing protein n=1 Tax=Lolium multiflorum TaxID=4521 RepID=A0AAD8TSH4_LOLMU|nr:hypothetical protein QYE76_047825 [Lolium multiflorum]
MDAFPLLFAICDNPDISVADAIHHDELHIRFRRSLDQEGLRLWGELQGLLTSVSISIDQDQVSWHLDPSGSYTVKSMYAQLSRGTTVAHAKDMWEAKLPLKIKIFSWQLALDKLPTGQQILTRHGPSNGLSVEPKGQGKRKGGAKLDGTRAKGAVRAAQAAGGLKKGRRGGAATAPRSPSPAPSSSSQDDRCFEFLLRIDDDPLGIKRLSDKFAEFIDGVEPAHMQLWEASCNFCQWTVEVLFDGQGKMYLHTRWDKFARDLALVPGCQLTFLYEGDGEMIVKVFDDIACRRHYHTGESGSDTDS